MSIPLLVYYVLAEMISAIESAPLGNGISDPLVSSVELPDDKLSNELTIFRRDIPPEEIINTGKYDGYIFNQNRCIQFNNRILCGYDKNKGTQLDDYTMIDIGSGCRARGDRIECGYDNPPRIITNLRHPDFKHVIHEEHRAHDVPHEEHRAHDVPHEEHRTHDVPHKEHRAHDVPHEEHRAHDVPHEEHRTHDVPHGEHDAPQHKHNHNGLTRQAPTRTAMTTDPTIPYVLESVESDYLENELIKSAFGKLVLKDEDTIIKSVKLATASIKPINLTTDAVKPVSITTIKPIKHTSTLTPERKISKSSTATKTTSTTEKITTVADSQIIKRMIKLASRKKNIETSSDSPQLLSTDNFKSYTTTVSPISKPCKTRNEENLETTCVEQGDRIVCYDFRKS